MRCKRFPVLFFRITVSKTFYDNTFLPQTHSIKYTTSHLPCPRSTEFWMLIYARPSSAKHYFFWSSLIEYANEDRFKIFITSKIIFCHQVVLLPCSQLFFNLASIPELLQKTERDFNTSTILCLDSTTFLRFLSINITWTSFSFATTNERLERSYKKASLHWKPYFMTVISSIQMNNLHLNPFCISRSFKDLKRFRVLMLVECKSTVQ